MGFFQDIGNTITANVGGTLNSALGMATDAGVAPLIPGYGQYLGQKEANAANLTSAREQMIFQERMANTTHQREVEDLKKAGLNPILSANAGAPAPVGAKAELKNASEGVSEAAVNAIKSYMDIMQSNAQTDLLRAQEKNVMADTGKKGVETKVLTQDIPKAEITNDLYKWGKKLFDKLTDRESWKTPKPPKGGYDYKLGVGGIPIRIPQK